MVILDNNVELIIRAFRAIDDPVSSEKYAKGHLAVLKSVGVTKVTSANLTWMNDPAVFVILVEDKETGTALGGARINLAGGTELLPIESALLRKDPQIIPMVQTSFENGGTGELCGLWNSKSVAGLGIGSIFVTRACIAVLSQLQIKTLYGFAASYTLKMSLNLGYEVITELGENGYFYYPKENLVAYALKLLDVSKLDLANEDEKHHILSLRDSYDQIYFAETKKGRFKIHYKLSLPFKTPFLK